MLVYIPLNIDNFELKPFYLSLLMELSKKKYAILCMSGNDYAGGSDDTDMGVGL